MTRWILAASAAALAITAPAFAERGGQGGDKGSKGGQSGQSAKADHGGKGAGKAAIKGDGRGNAAFKGDGGGKSMRAAEKGNRGGSDSVKLKGRGDNRGDLRGRNDVRIVDRDDDRLDRRFADNDDRREWDSWCPPGLAKKLNGCLPPGQAKTKLGFGARLSNAYAQSLIPAGYRSWFPDNDDYYYRSGNGFIYQVNRSNGLVDGLIPFGSDDGYYMVGQQYPSAFDFYNVPTQYRSYYADSDSYNYRYGDDAIYRVNRSNGLIDSVVALLAGDLGVGNSLPMGYDAYNVPLNYRDRYADNADAMYRYNDGYIYQVDPKTRLIQAVIQALV